MTPLNPRYRERLLALVILALVLFCPPVLLIIDRLPSSSIGWLPGYLFGAWAVIIGLTAWLMEHPKRR
ncbi:hypothetical protein [Vreelandella populi]|uniref:Uncharacterized protein n=1 Tax=Vreelandella populi TaxID=2498858 RepID=A0A433LAY8_9GAMM|nr:hypothetical protein [Halomonas populi]RUR36603.1 hypothetical protein ELY25_13225 [Halomonas populi]RUR45065.1 hypothetical protein ELY37_13455 [Halomonas populi]RUR51451.1 hypothetical protein ELY40_16785 [Halomonas populi]